LNQLRLVQPGQQNVSRALARQTDRILRFNELARIAPSNGIGASGFFIDAGVGRSVDLRV
jgi:hypothetical protein